MNTRYKWKWFRTFDEFLEYIDNEPSFKLKTIKTYDTKYTVIFTEET